MLRWFGGSCWILRLGQPRGLLAALLAASGGLLAALLAGVLLAALLAGGLLAALLAGSLLAALLAGGGGWVDVPSSASRKGVSGGVRTALSPWVEAAEPAGVDSYLRLASPTGAVSSMNESPLVAACINGDRICQCTSLSCNYYLLM